MSCEIKNLVIYENQNMKIEDNDQIEHVPVELKNESDIKSSRISIEILKSHTDEHNIEKKTHRNTPIPSFFEKLNLKEKEALSKKAKIVNELTTLRPLLVKYVLLDPATALSNVLNVVNEYIKRLDNEKEVSDVSGAFQASPKASIHLEDLKDILLEDKGVENLQECNSIFHHRIPCAIKSLCTIIAQAKVGAKRDSYKLKQLQSSLIDLTKKILAATAKINESLNLSRFVEIAPGVAYIITDIDPLEPTLENQNLYVKHLNMVISTLRKILTKGN